MKYEVAKQNAQQFANDRGQPVYITKADKLNDFQVEFSKEGITKHYSIIETVIPTTAKILISGNGCAERRALRNAMIDNNLVIEVKE